MTGVSLGSITKTASQITERERGRYHLQELISNILPEEERLSWCLRRPTPRNNVQAVYYPKSNRSHFHNVMLCGSVWGCPVCSARVTEQRRKELSGVIGEWGGSVVMGAFTVQHRAGDRLADVKGVLFQALRSLTAGRYWQGVKQRYSIIGTIQANEVTWSSDNGWHPHRHILFVSDRKWSKDETASFQDEIRGRFAEIVRGVGGYSSDQWGVKITTGTKQETSEYCFKWGMDYELLGFQGKRADQGHYKPFELADLFGVTGDQRYRLLFREYYFTFKGSKRVTYSRGLKKAMGIPDRKDRELLQAEDQSDNGYIVTAELTGRAYKAVCMQNRRGELLEITTGAITNECSFEGLSSLVGGMGLCADRMKSGVVMIYAGDEPAPQFKVIPAFHYTGGAVLPASPGTVYRGGAVIPSEYQLLTPGRSADEVQYQGGAISPGEFMRWEYSEQRGGTFLKVDSTFRITF